MSDAPQLPEICPFLASVRDSDSVLNYPSVNNVCHKLGDPLPIAADYQAGYCLRTRHWFCPIYTGSVKKPPVPIRYEGALLEGAKNASLVYAPALKLDHLPAPPEPISRGGQLRLSVLIGLLIFMVVVGALFAAVRQNGEAHAVIRSTATDLALSAPLTATLTQTVTLTISYTASSTATQMLTPTDTDLPTLTATLMITASPLPTASTISSATNTASATASPTPTSTATTPSSAVPAKSCAVPTGWQPYTVAPGETYFRVAVKFNTTVDALQRVNCLSNPGRLLAGQTIYVPPPTAGLTVSSAAPVP